jgi:sugar lactone lactonase YvrE
MGLRALVLAVGCLVLTLAGCSDDADRSDDRATAGSPTPSAAEAPASGPPPATPAEFDRTLRIAYGPDWLAAGFGSIWVKRGNGAVDRVSPAGKVEATIDADIFQQPVCQGVGVSETAVWACATPGTLIRIDPATNEFSLVRIPKVNEQGRLTTSGGLLWVLTGDGDRLEGVDDDGEVRTTVDLGRYCTDTADTADAGSLWVVCAYDGVVLRVDLEAAEVTGEVGDLPHAVAVSVAGDVWVGHDEGLSRIDPGSLEVVEALPLHVGSIRATGDDVWVRSPANTFLNHVDAASGEITLVLESPVLNGYGDVVEFKGRRWVSGDDDGVLLRLSR